MTGYLSPEDLEYLRRSCEESGVPVTITDPIALDEAAEILRPTSKPTEGRRAA